MKFSTRTVYGLKAILVLAFRYGEGSVAVSQIAKRENISTAYLEQILNALKKKGVVKSVRGPQGGYVLAKKPAELGLDALFYVLDGRPFADPEGPANADETAVANALFWRKFKTSLDEGLGGATLKDLVDEARRAKKSRSHPLHTFHI